MPDFIGLVDPKSAERVLCEHVAPERDLPHVFGTRAPEIRTTYPVVAVMHTGTFCDESCSIVTMQAICTTLGIPLLDQHGNVIPMSWWCWARALMSTQKEEEAKRLLLFYLKFRNYREPIMYEGKQLADGSWEVGNTLKNYTWHFFLGWC